MRYYQINLPNAINVFPFLAPNYPCPPINPLFEAPDTSPANTPITARYKPSLVMP